MFNCVCGNFYEYIPHKIRSILTILQLHRNLTHGIHLFQLTNKNCEIHLYIYTYIYIFILYPRIHHLSKAPCRSAGTSRSVSARPRPRRSSSLLVSGFAVAISGDCQQSGREAAEHESSDTAAWQECQRRVRAGDCVALIGRGMAGGAHRG